MKITKYAAPLILAFLGLLLYSNTLYSPFIFDDEWYIVENYQIRDISNFFKDFSGTRYIGFLSFAINYYFGELNTFGYHLVNVIIHILNAILVYILIQAMGNRLEAIGKPIDHSPAPIAFFISLIFLVHPIQTQAVSYITQRFTSLATLFYLLALVLYVKCRLWAIGNGQLEKPRAYRLSPIAYCLSLISAILAMKTKEISFTLPFIIALYEFTFFREEPPLPLRERVGACPRMYQSGVRGIFSGKIRSRLLYLLPFFLTLLIIPLTLIISGEEISVSETLRKKQLGDIENLSIYNYILTQFMVILTYIRLLIFPANQNLLYDYPLSNSILEPAAFLSFLFLLSIFSFAVYLYFRSHKTHNSYGILISFGIIWFFLTLSVESSVIPIYDVIFEHRIYLPSIGFYLSLTTAAFYGFNYIEKKAKKSLTNYLISIILTTALVLSILTYKRNILWGNEYLMWQDVISKSPNRIEAHDNLGNVYFRQGRFDDAIKEYIITLRLKPDYALAHNNLGIAYFAQGRLDDAIKEYLAALRFGPNLSNARYNLGNAYAKQNRFNEAVKEYLLALELKPNDANVRYNLGNAYFNQGRFDEAIKEYKTALKLEPDFADAHNNIGFVYYKQGLIDNAINEYLIALKLKPDDEAEIHYNLGNAYFDQGRFDEAIKEYKTALKLEPDFADAHNNIGFIYYKQGLIDNAINEYLIALKLKPDDEVEIHYNLGLAYLEKGLKHEAKREFKTALELKPDFASAKKAIESLERESVKNR